MIDHGAARWNANVQRKRAWLGEEGEWLSRKRGGIRAPQLGARSPTEAPQGTRGDGCERLKNTRPAGFWGEGTCKQRLGQHCAARWQFAYFSFAGCCHSKGFPPWSIAPRSSNRAFPRFYPREMWRRWRRRNALRPAARKVSRKVSRLLVGGQKMQKNWAGSVHRHLWCNAAGREEFLYLRSGIVFPLKKLLKAKFRIYLRLWK